MNLNRQNIGNMIQKLIFQLELPEDDQGSEDDFRRKRNVKSVGTISTPLPHEISNLGDLLYPSDFASGSNNEYLQEISNLAELLYPTEMNTNTLDETVNDYSIDPLKKETVGSKLEELNIEREIPNFDLEKNVSIVSVS